MAENEWNEKAKRLIKAELKRANITYDELARRLTEIGMPETKASVSNKISRGAFPAGFLLATLKVIGRDVIRVDDV